MSKGKIYVNGTLFDYPKRTLQDAITTAGYRGSVGIEGTVYTLPIGSKSKGVEKTIKIDNVSIIGIGDKAAIKLKPFYFKDIKSQIDLLTIRGSNVTISNLKLDAGYRVDFALRLLESDNVDIRNVVAQKGTRGAINILTGNKSRFFNVVAQKGIQGGFYFDACGDCLKVFFHDCHTKSNWRTGILIRNTYGSTFNLNLSGITVHEGHMGIEDRKEGIIHDMGTSGEIKNITPPCNSKKWLLDCSCAKYKLNLDSKKYSHFRFDSKNKKGKCFIESERHGMTYKKFYSFVFLAKRDKRMGELISKQ